MPHPLSLARRVGHGRAAAGPGSWNILDHATACPLQDATRGRDLPGRPVQSVRFASSSSRRGHARVTLELSSACSLDWSNAARIYVGYSVKAGHAPDVVVRFIYIRRSRLLKKIIFFKFKGGRKFRTLLAPPTFHSNRYIQVTCQTASPPTFHSNRYIQVTCQTASQQ